MYSMGPHKFNYLYLATAALLLLAASRSPVSTARSYIGVNPFCRTSDYRRICTQMVNGASTWLDASANAMISTRELATRLKDMVAPLVKPAVADLELNTQESIMTACVEDFGAVVDDLDVSLQAVRAADNGTAQSHLSGALRSDCKDAMKKFGPDFPLNKYVAHLTIKLDNCLAVLMQI